MGFSFGKFYPDNIISVILGKEITTNGVRQLNALNHILRNLSTSDQLLIRCAYELRLPFDSKFESIVNMKKDDAIYRITEIINILSTEENKKLLEEGMDIDHIPTNYRNRRTNEMTTNPNIDLQTSHISKGIHYNKFKDYPYPDNLIYYIHDDDSVEITDDIRNGLEHILNNMLKKRETEVLKFRFQNHKTLKEIAEYYGCTSTRIAQNISTATRKLRSKNLFIYVEKGLNIAKTEHHLQGDIPIEELGLSVRALNCLRRVKLTTAKNLSDFINNYEGDKPWHFTIRNLGKKSAKEIIDALNAKGFKTKRVFFATDVTETVDSFTFKEAISDNELVFTVNGEDLHFKMMEYDIPDTDVIYLNTYSENGTTYFVFDDAFDDTSRIISWRMISRLISVVLGNSYK